VEVFVMKEKTRIWIVGGALIVAGVVMAVVGASIDVREVQVAVPAMGAALVAGGLTTLLVRLPLGGLKN
jgi:drug/metabolite transporter (DMT)-like permease